MDPTWITFPEAAEIAGCSVGDLCRELSASGCVDPFVGMAATTAVYHPPAHPRVRVNLGRSVVGSVVVRANSTGSIAASALVKEDLIEWLAYRSASMLKTPLNPLNMLDDWISGGLLDLEAPVRGLTKEGLWYGQEPQGMAQLLQQHLVAAGRHRGEGGKP